MKTKSAMAPQLPAKAMARDVPAVRPDRSSQAASATAMIVPIAGMPTKFVSAEVSPIAVYSGMASSVPMLRGVGDAALLP